MLLISNGNNERGKSTDLFLLENKPGGFCIKIKLLNKLKSVSALVYIFSYYLLKILYDNTGIIKQTKQ